MPKYSNLDPKVRPQFDKFFKWAVLDRLSGNRPPSHPKGAVPVVDQCRPGPVTEPSVTWLGHATALISLAGRRVLTDPVFSLRLGPGIRRYVPLVLEIDALPEIDLVLISHNHRDHLDAPSIKRLEAHCAPDYIVPLGVERYLRRWGVDSARITSLNWWEKAEVSPELTVSHVPSQHWSQRGAFDRNRSLWGGYVLTEADGSSIYFAGDSGYFNGFEEIGRRHPEIDVALIPIGAYAPEWFMSPQHINPEHAGQVFLDVGAKRMIPIHWGTFKLSDEPMDEPPARLTAWRDAQGLTEAQVVILPVGGRLVL